MQINFHFIEIILSYMQIKIGITDFNLKRLKINFRIYFFNLKWLLINFRLLNFNLRQTKINSQLLIFNLYLTAINSKSSKIGYFLAENRSVDWKKRKASLRRGVKKPLSWPHSKKTISFFRLFSSQIARFFVSLPPHSKKSARLIAR